MKKWKKPKFKEMRYGFEISMYIMNRQHYFQVVVTRKTSMRKQLVFSV